jgi:hypothetical protein
VLFLTKGAGPPQLSRTRSKDHANELSLSERSDQCTQRRYSRSHSGAHRRGRGDIRRGSRHLAALSLACVGTSWRKARCEQCGERHSIRVPRRTVGMGVEPLGGLHRDAPGAQNHRNGSRVPHRCELGAAISSVQDQPRCYSTSVCCVAACRVCMHDDDDNAGAALPACAGLRICRPVASLQTVSPRDRYKPSGLAPRDDSPIGASVGRPCTRFMQRWIRRVVKRARHRQALGLWLFGSTGPAHPGGAADLLAMSLFVMQLEQRSGTGVAVR